ncbi:hypothetical protein AAY473_018948 [Plecturocebus cupreus]
MRLLRLRSVYSTFSLALRDIGQGPGAARGDAAPRAGGLGELDSPSRREQPPPPSSSRLPLRLPRQQPPPRPLRGESCCPPRSGAVELEPGGSHSTLTPRACRAGAAEKSMKGWMRWLAPVVPARWKAEVSGSSEVRR